MNDAENRQILHIDMNAFYSACHAAKDPKRYKGVPTAVAGNPETRHGVIVTASYEARARGVKATMLVMQAQRLCPELIIIAPDFDLYRAYSRRVMQLVTEYTPQVEVASIDECYADVTLSTAFGDAQTIAKLLQARILTEIGLPCSIGVANNKFLAKMASDRKKPLGITVIFTKDVPTMLWPMNISDMFGVGLKSSERFKRLGIVTIGDLAHADEQVLYRVFGRHALDLIAHANGYDNAPVLHERAQAKSVGHSVTLARDEQENSRLLVVLMNLCDQVGRRLRKKKLLGKTVTITLRYANRKTITRAFTMPKPSDITEDFYACAKELVKTHWTGQPIRLLGVSVSNLLTQEQQLVDATQLSLFDEQEDRASQNDTRRHLTQVVDQLRDRFGEDAVLKGRMLMPSTSATLRDHRARGTSLQKDE